MCVGMSQEQEKNTFAHKDINQHERKRRKMMVNGVYLFSGENCKPVCLCVGAERRNGM